MPIGSRVLFSGRYFKGERASRTSKEGRRLPSVIAPPAAKITEPPAEMLSWNPSPAPLNSAKDPIHASPAPNDSAKDPIHASPAPPDSAKDPIHALPNLEVVYRRKGKS